MGIEYTAELDASAGEVWRWLARPGAIHRLIPPWQPMTVVREAQSLRDGAAELRIAGAPWTSQHLAAEYVEGSRFVDELTSFPLRVVNPWRHEHLVEPHGEHTLITDRVTSGVPAALLRSTFSYRERQLAGDLAAHAAHSRTPLTIAVTGASGLIGTQLGALLSTGGHRVIRLVRRPVAGTNERTWDPAAPAADLLDGVDAVVHLAGASIAGRFTEAHKRAIRDSRIGPTRRLAELAAAAGAGTFVSASAIGIYGADRADEPLDERSAPGTDFLAGVVAGWEADAVAGVSGSATRAVQVRTGLVLTPRGGYLRPMRPLFSLGVGGRLGSGDEWLSWIGIDDLLDVYLRALTDPSLIGPVNAVAPNPVQSRDFAKVFGHVLRRPAVVPVPSFGPKLLLGAEGAAEIVEASQLVRPARLTAAGHTFRHPDLADALRHLMGQVVHPAG
ncbi:TIGR01777 family oxidoreductase [Nakamurella lactea]|uniref:TIGR01777 family oxidoreductase n=1 Tax=Nakamurella lactea TaxID=459515 RepID=UPI0004181513|nr:TIGR01777 family oxidoreductase [Nakamurella lactea]